MQDPSVRLDIKNKFIDAVRYRDNLCETRWNLNERGIYGVNGTMSINDIDTSEAGIRDFIINSQHDDNDAPDVVINYAFRDVRLIHAQMSANPPVVTARPATTDGEDLRRSEAANFVIEFGKDYYKMMEHIDLCNLSTIVYGTGYIITAWNPLGGHLVSYDEKTGETEMEGEIRIYSPDTWDILIDAKAKRKDDIRFFIEKQEIPLDLAQAMFPNHWQKLLEQSNPNAQDGDSYAEGLRDVNLQQEQSIYIYKYYEKGLPINAMQGRFCFLDKAGEVIGKVDVNPYQFVTSVQGKDEGEETTPMPSAQLPLHILTDVDVPCQVYGKSWLDWSLQSQDTMNRIDSMRMDNVRAAGISRMIVPADANIPEDKITDDAFEIITSESNLSPFYVNPPSLYGDVDKIRETLRGSIDELAGVNDAMLGESQRETSGYQMSYATNQANMVRRRLFNKYIQHVQDSYEFYLNLAIKHWDLPKTIKVLGSENAYDTLDIAGQDISSGYHIKVEYGSAFSLDPTTKRQELLE